MAVLVLNAGSSSLKFRLYAGGPGEHLQSCMDGAVTGFGPHAAWRWRAGGAETRGHAEIGGHRAAAAWVLRRVQAHPGAAVEAVGHRVVHGGEVFQQPAELTPENIARLEGLSRLAPLHNPPALEGIRACRDALGAAVPMVAVFDTAFHAHLPEPARRYALPDAWADAYGIRRYGFHGLAHRSMYERYLARRAAQPGRPRVIAFQLGHGCSASAIRDDASVETSMGYTPLEGLVMATRSGDVDPGALARLVAEGVGTAELDEGLNQGSGLLALSGASGDMQALLALEAQGHAGARRAIEVFCHRARKYLGAYLAVLGGADAILFGGGIGEHAPAIRARICAGMQWCAVQLDERVNAATVGNEARLSIDGATPEVYAIAVDEEILIARDTCALLAAGS